MVTLFDEFERVESRPATPRDRDYEYLSHTSRPAFSLVRRILESWFTEYPASCRAELAGRFRSPETVTHRGAFFELYCHALLRAYGFEVETHPELEGKGKPDFLAIRDGKPAFYLEATNVLPSVEQQAESARDGLIDDCITNLGLTSFYVAKSLRTVGKHSPSLTKLRNFLLKTAASLDPNDVAVAHRRFKYCDQDWEFNFRFLPKSPSLRDGGSRASLGITTGPVCYPAPEKGIAVSLKKKAGKYGTPKLPLVIAVNCLHEFVELEDIAAALYGAEGASSNDAFFRSPYRARYTRVSAALVVVQLAPWTIGSVDGWLWRNPAAARPLDRSDWPGSQVHWSDESSCLKQSKGATAPQILGTDPVSAAIRSEHDL